MKLLYLKPDVIISQYLCSGIAEADRSAQLTRSENWEIQTRFWPQIPLSCRAALLTDELFLFDPCPPEGGDFRTAIDGHR